MGRKKTRREKQEQKKIKNTSGQEIKFTELLTYKIDTLRQSADGFIRPLSDSVFMIVAIKYFAAPDFWKSIIASSSFIGFFLASPFTGFLSGRKFPRSNILFYLTLVSSLLMFFSVLSENGKVFAAVISMSVAVFYLRQPYYTELYGDMYPAERRAMRISPGLRINQVLTVAAGFLYGRLLDYNLSSWRWIIAAGAVILALSGTLLKKLPETDRSGEPEWKWTKGLIKPFTNKKFLYIEASWMIIGFANLWTLPLKAVYLAENRRGLGLSTTLVTVILVVIPVGFKLLFNPVWASFYTKSSFPVFRIAVNVLFFLSFPFFFATSSLPVIIAASVLFGIAASGSPFIWQLWVTRLVGPGEVKIYQSAHIALAGFRGIIAPFIGFSVLGALSFRTIGYISGAAGLLATLMIIPLLHPKRVF